MIRLFTLAAVFLTPAVTVCQVVRLTGGNSDVLGDGAQATYFAPQETITGSIGYRDHLAFGAQDAFDFHGLQAVAGQEQIALAVDGGSASPVNSGFSLSHKSDDASFKAFVGSTGLGYSTPFFSTAKIQHVGAGVAGSWTASKRVYAACSGFGCNNSMHHFTFSGLAAADGGKKYLAGGLAYRVQRFYATGSVGTLAKQRYWQAVTAWQPVRALSMSAIHASYFPQSFGVVAPNFSMDTANANLTFKIFSFGGGVAKSSLSPHPGESVNAGVRLGSISIQSTYLRSSSQSIFLHQATERFRHLSVTGTVTQVTQGGNTRRNAYNVSGGFTANRFSLALSHSIQMLLTGQFVQTTAVSISVRLPHDLVVHADTATDIFGRTTHTAQIETYQQIGNETARAKQTFAKTGRFVIRGRCEDEMGEGVSGCVIVFTDGKRRAEIISGGDGQFQFREKQNDTVAISVDVNDFVTSGGYIVVSTPNSAKPDEDFRVVVRRNN